MKVTGISYPRYWWIVIKSKMNVIYLPQIRTFWWCIKLSFKFLTGRAAIIDSRETRSNGGFKYLNIDFTYLPVSSYHNYEDF